MVGVRVGGGSKRGHKPLDRPTVKKGVNPMQNGLIFFDFSFPISTFQFIPFLPKDKENSWVFFRQSKLREVFQEEPLGWEPTKAEEGLPTSDFRLLTSDF